MDWSHTDKLGKTYLVLVGRRTGKGSIRGSEAGDAGRWQAQNRFQVVWG